MSSCDTMDCENGSTCVEEDGAAVCVCPPGATGQRCELCKYCVNLDLSSRHGKITL